MEHAHALAYLAGIVDGDGYMKLTPNYAASAVHPYYAAIVGVQQLWPSEAVKLFATMFGGKLRIDTIPSGKKILRSEVGGAVGASALRRLLPFLLLKRAQAILLLEVARVRPRRRGRPLPGDTSYRTMETIREGLEKLHSGTWRHSEEAGLIHPFWNGCVTLSPSGLGWSRRQLIAYLAGVIDSDGNLRVEKKRVHGMIGPNYRINIRCSQVEPSAAVELLANTFGGRITLKKSKRPNSRDLVAWSLHDRSAARAVEALLPHLRVKHTEAVLLLELRALKDRGKKGFTTWFHRTRSQRPHMMRKRCYTPEQNAEFERIFRAVQALHSGGRGIESPARAR